MSKGDMASVERNKRTVGSLNIKEREICLREYKECELWLTASFVLSVYIKLPNVRVTSHYQLVCSDGIMSQQKKINKLKKPQKLLPLGHSSKTHERSYS